MQLAAKTVTILKISQKRQNRWTNIEFGELKMSFFRHSDIDKLHHIGVI